MTDSEFTEGQKVRVVKEFPPGDDFGGSRLDGVEATYVDHDAYDHNYPHEIRDSEGNELWVHSVEAVDTLPAKGEKFYVNGEPVYFLGESGGYWYAVVSEGGSPVRFEPEKFKKAEEVVLPLKAGDIVMNAVYTSDTIQGINLFDHSFFVVILAAPYLDGVRVFDGTTGTVYDRPAADFNIDKYKVVTVT